MAFYLHHSTYHMTQAAMPLAAPVLGIAKKDIAIYQHFFGLKHIAYSHTKQIDHLLIQALKKLFNDSPLEPSDVDLLIHAHTHHMLSPLEKPHLSSLKKQFKSMDCPCFGMSLNNCASFLSAIDMARHLLCHTEGIQHAIILTGDLVFTKEQRQIPRTAVMGECATSCWLSNEPSPHKLIDIHYQSHGQYAKGSLMDAKTQRHFEAHYLDYLHDIITQTLSTSKLSISQIKLIIPHNVNLLSWQRYAKKHGVPINKLFLRNIERYGHCYNADLPLNWTSIDFNQHLQPGDYYVMVTVGLGAIFAAALWQYQGTT